MTIPIECVDADPLLRDLLVDNAIGYWLGDGRLAHGFAVVRYPRHCPSLWV
jgi:hypothetical protein